MTLTPPPLVPPCPTTAINIDRRALLKSSPLPHRRPLHVGSGDCRTRSETRVAQIGSSCRARLVCSAGFDVTLDELIAKERLQMLTDNPSEVVTRGSSLEMRDRLKRLQRHSADWELKHR